MRYNFKYIKNTLYKYKIKMKTKTNERKKGDTDNE
jgi:hypothetical protein